MHFVEGPACLCQLCQRVAKPSGNPESSSVPAADFVHNARASAHVGRTKSNGVSSRRLRREHLRWADFRRFRPNLPRVACCGLQLRHHVGERLLQRPPARPSVQRDVARRCRVLDVHVKFIPVTGSITVNPNANGTRHSIAHPNSNGTRHFNVNPKSNGVSSRRLRREQLRWAE